MSKYETPLQYEERTKTEWIGPVWFKLYASSDWRLVELSYIRGFIRDLKTAEPRVFWTLVARNHAKPDYNYIPEEIVCVDEGKTDNGYEFSTVRLYSRAKGEK